MKRDTPPLNTVGTKERVKRTPKVPRKSPEAYVESRKKYLDLSTVPTAQIGDVVDPNKPLTEMAQRFVKFWAEGESISAASARAGYANPSLAYRIVHFPQAIALYQAEKAKYEEACQMTRKRVMEGLLDGVDMAKLEGEPMAVIAGWREIGRMCGYYEPVKQQIDINITGHGVMDRLNRLSDADLLRLVTEGIQTPGAAPLALVDEVSPAADMSLVSPGGDA